MNVLSRCHPLNPANCEILFRIVLTLNCESKTMIGMPTSYKWFPVLFNDTPLMPRLCDALGSLVDQDRAGPF